MQREQTSPRLHTGPRAFVKGDPVKVRGMRGDFRFYAYFVGAYVPPMQYATVYGGPPGRAMFRTVALDRVIEV